MFTQQKAETIGNVISRLWIFSFFAMVYRDTHEIAVADTIEGILVGTYEGKPVTDAGLVARRLNLFMPPITIFGVIYFIPNDLDDFVLAAATVVAVLKIFLISIFCRTEGSRSVPGEVRHAI